jgi:serine/threonine protein kinase
MTRSEPNNSDPDSAAETDDKTRVVPRVGVPGDFASGDAGSVPPATPDDMATRVVSRPAATRVQTASGAPQSLPVQPAPPGEIDQPAAASPGIVAVGSILKQRFVLEEVIARGGMGVVYRARDLRKEQYNDRHPYVAVKVLGEECKAHPDSFIGLQRETDKTQKLAHPNIVTVHDFDSDGDIVFMTMEYLEGETLDDFIKNQRPGSLDRKTALAMISGMAQGLAYAHKKGIVHCDFKPGNVFLTRDGTVKTLDFGISRAVKKPEQLPQDATVFDAGTFGALTPSYASCEMIEEDEPDPRDDIYALACVAYELLAGHHPFNRLQATDARDNKIKPAPVKELSKRQWKALMHGLAFDRKARTATVHQFLSELKGGNLVLGLSRPLVATLGVLILMTTAGIFALKQITPLTAPVPTSPFASLETDEPVVLTAEQKDKVNRLHEAAEIHYLVGRITTPTGSNAHDAYRHILDIDPRNAQARDGLLKIANRYEYLAQEKLDSGDAEASRAMIETGLEVYPGHPGLIGLKRRIDPVSKLDQLVYWARNLFAGR